MLNLKRHCQNSSILHSHQQCMRVPVAPHCQAFLILAILVYVLVVLSPCGFICTSLMTDDEEHFSGAYLPYPLL